ncbi:hypothetical protein FACS1894185_6610 [Betaproteobacteria bacterium]|nr:hypothetical protein FACS1894185_6610 [Betaproteobacteria bacterium]
MLATETFMMNSSFEQAVRARGYTVGSNPCGKDKQQGAVLIIGLILLMVITLLALAGIQGVSLQGRMSGNAYDRNIAFNTAEVGLRWAELQLLKGTEDANLGTFHTPDNTDEDDYTDYTVKGKADVSASTGVSGITEPKIAVVDLGDSCFMVNSEGVGRGSSSSNTKVVLQSVVCRDS